jgi:carboxyl-terminal processing protease
MFNYQNWKAKKRGTSVVAIILLAAIFAGGYYWGSSRAASQTPSQLAYSQDTVNVTAGTSTSQSIDFNLYWEVWDSLKSNFVDKNKVKDQDLFYGSLKGMAAAAGDPYTVFMDPTDAKTFSDDLAGTFQGIGAEVGMRNDIITIIAPLDGTPAKKAGLLAGDKIYAVDGKATLGLTIDQAVKEIRGKEGTTVTLTIIRGKDKAKDYKIVRSVIVVKSVTTTMRSDGLFVIRVSNFNEDTSGLFSQAVTAALAKKPKGLILDLRDNPGGYLDTAVAMASEWIKGGPVVAEQFGDNRRNEYPSNGLARLASIPTVVLVNGGSASASEIVAGALRDYKEATLVGEKTFGKGSVQTLNELSDGAELKVTVAKWLTPAGDFINEKGITPSIVVPLTQSDLDKSLDPQMAKAVQLLTAKKK